MSLRDKAKEIKAAGEAERGNFTPDGVPKRAYQWWLNESTSKRASAIRSGYRKENFCHFWRVVLFWAPVRKVVYTIDKLFFNKIVGGIFVAAILLGLLTIAVLNPLDALAIVGAAIVMSLQIVGVLAGVSAALSAEKRSEWDMIQDNRLIAVLFVLGFVLAIPAFVITKAVTYYKAHLTEYSGPIFLTAIGIAITAALLAIGLGSGLPALITVVSCAALIVVGYFFVRMMISVLGPFIQGKRAVSEARRRDAEAVYVAENGELPAHVPSRLSKFFTGLGDFIVLMAQVIRTKKWKICPMVEIDT